MEIADAQKFLQENHRGCIAVRQKDGWPQMTFVTPGIDPEGRVIITSRGNLRRAVPRIKFCADPRRSGNYRTARGDGYLDLLAQTSARRSQESG
jgi:hypothetical protein